jgi:DNA-binding PadR family transcriptional regulator
MALSYAILSALIDRPSSGYDLAKDFDRRVSHFWHASHQQIYRELSRMEQEGWVRIKLIEQQDRPDRKLYSITQEGKKALAKWVATPSEVAKIREDLLVKLRAGTLVDPQVLVDELARHRQAHREILEFYDSVRTRDFAQPESLPPADALNYLVLRCGMLYERAYLTWCDEALELLGRPEPEP